MMQEYWIEKCVQESEKERPDGAKRAGGRKKRKGGERSFVDNQEVTEDR